MAQLLGYQLQGSSGFQEGGGIGMTEGMEGPMAECGHAPAIEVADIIRGEHDASGHGCHEVFMDVEFAIVF